MKRLVVAAKSSGRRLEYEDDLVVIEGPDGEQWFKGTWDEAMEIGYEDDDLLSFSNGVYQMPEGATMRVLASKSAIKSSTVQGPIFHVVGYINLFDSIKFVNKDFDTLAEAQAFWNAQDWVDGVLEEERFTETGREFVTHEDIDRR